MNGPIVYRIFDTEKQEYWETFKQKVWLKPGSAKNAWNVGYYQHYTEKVVFNKQSRFVIHAFNLTFAKEIK